MANPLTGDFEAVLQVSGGTISRFVASMHQNAFANPDVPSFPHSVSMRIGDGRAIDGVKGYVQAQISVPLIQLIHGATDRFRLEVGVRAWYRPDQGTKPFPAFIHGTVRAEYHIQDIDPTCPGWKRIANLFMWVRVVKDSVRFEGTTAPDTSGLLGVDTTTEADEAANITKVTRQIAGLLATQFVASPHRVTSNQFKRGRMRSLNAAGGSAVAIPLGLSSNVPVGNIASVNTLLLEGADLAVGVSVEYILSIVQAKLAPFAAFTQTVAVHVDTPPLVPDIDTVYHASVTPPVVTWEPQSSYAVFTVKVHGSAVTRSVLPNVVFDVDQKVILNFDAGTGRFWLAPGTLSVTVHASGFGSGAIIDAVQPHVTDAVRPLVTNACAQAQPELDAMTSRTPALTEQLRTIDPQASARLDRAQFVPAGIVARGTIGLGARRGPVVLSEKAAEQNGHSAFQSWIPGGRIDSLEWSWTWFTKGLDPGKATHEDRFLLRRPHARPGRWGVSATFTTPLPGIDGSGHVCLRITGVQVDANTGQLVPVQSVKQCTRFGIDVGDSTTLEQKPFPRLLYREPELSLKAQFPERALVRAGAGHDATTAANTLLVYVDETWSPETAHSLSGGLEGCRRFDAGLALLVLFKDGRLAGAGQQLQPEIEAFARENGIAALVNEDVRGGWSKAFSLPSGAGSPSWRLIAPDGTVTWAHDGHVSSDTLTGALDTHLYVSQDHSAVTVRPGLQVGDLISGHSLDPELFEVEPRCPPLVLKRSDSTSVVAFVQPHSVSSNARLKELFNRYGQTDDGPALMVVVDGATAREAEALMNDLGMDAVTVPDPSGAITDRFGVAVWPTTISIDEKGRISDIETGFTSPDEGDGGDDTPSHPGGGTTNYPGGTTNYPGGGATKY